MSESHLQYHLCRWFHDLYLFILCNVQILYSHMFSSYRFLRRRKGFRMVENKRMVMHFTCTEAKEHLNYQLEHLKRCTCALQERLMNMTLNTIATIKLFGLFFRCIWLVLFPVCLSNNNNIPLIKVNETASWMQLFFGNFHILLVPITFCRYVPILVTL